MMPSALIVSAWSDLTPEHPTRDGSALDDHGTDGQALDDQELARPQPGKSTEDDPARQNTASRPSTERPDEDQNAVAAAPRPAESPERANERISAIVRRVRANRGMTQQLASMGRQMEEAAHSQEQQQRIVVGMITGMTVSLTVGYVAWSLRAGSLLASVMSSVPLWTCFDPLAVLSPSKSGQNSLHSQNGNEGGEEEQEFLFGPRTVLRAGKGKKGTRS